MAVAGKPAQGNVHQATDRTEYFTGRYAGSELVSALSGKKDPKKHNEPWLADYDLPDSLSHCIMELVRVLRERGLGAAMEALRDDRTIGRVYESRIRLFLTAIEMYDRHARS
jgi:hypothetical protein